MGTISKALDLLEYFRSDRSEIGLSEFVRLSGRDKATVHRHLTELEGKGFLEQHPVSRAYRLGPAVLRLSALREASFPVRRLLTPIVADLSEAVGELAHASLLQGNALSPVAHADPCLHGVQVHFDPAEMLPLHATASGLAALAFGPEEWRERMLARPLGRFTGKTVADAAGLRDRIDTTRRFGLSMSAGTFDEEVTSLGAPLFADGARLAGALAVAVPSARARPERLEDIAGRLLRSAARASTSLGGTVARAPQSPPAAFADWMRRELEYVT